jgi:alpha-L-rhamnosidase
VLGVQPVEPGFRSWRVQPEPYGLNWAQGAVPTPYGAIASRWQLGASSSSFKLTTAAPGGTSGTVAVPLLGAPRVIAEDGHVVWKGSAPVAGAKASSDGTYVVFPDVTGTHTWAW